MLQFLNQLLFQQRKKKNGTDNKKQQASAPQTSTTTTEEPVSSSLMDTVAYLKYKMGGSSDFIVREFRDSDGVSRVAVIYINGLIDQQLISKLMEGIVSDEYKQLSQQTNPAEWLKNQLPIGDVRTIYGKEELLHAILAGQTAIIIDGVHCAFTAPIQGGARRSVEEPSSQTVVRGPKEGFTEDIGTNIALLRRKIRSADLRLESRTLGRYTQTKIAVAYIQGIADPEVVKEVSRRLDTIHTDSILEGGYIEEFIQDGVISPFPTLLNTERPDAIAGGLLEGLVAIFVDGTPFVLLAPVTFFRFFASPEDYYQGFYLASFLRIIRFGSFLVALLLPSLYIATTTFQQEMLPTTLLISLAAQRENTPLPALLEAFVMELTFEIIREAGVRMPRAIGPAISIVGALVLGQAAVQAGLVSAAMVIVVSFTAISNFVLPYINMAASIRLLRFILMILGGSFGLYGIQCGLVPIMTHLVSLRSFGVPYYTPVSPVYFHSLKDLVIRTPWWRLKSRPAILGDQNPMRQAAEPDSFAQQKRNHERDPLP
ncbi:spore germination protein [Paenibacillus jiagnxiensis]|uniref:spore germination protein n=1 Tax=Paenibacillus jiagnxiensis TaxID=3228926 RepID=UPI0038D50B6D